ncbi:MAG: glycosyltransferase family 39 protein [Candidatus Parcubacteria bacterium]|nr:glycosyltransferase family 39 protein [Candidatus Parcubacteria bacterium]
MNFLSKYRMEIIAFIVITALYFLLRLIFLTYLPIFTDEAIYVRWAQIALRDASWRFISLTDGKQPLFIWVSMISMKFIQDPLLAGRIVSVVSGFFTMLGLWFLSLELFKNKKAAFLTTIIYIFYPFAQVLDRMALYDSMVGTFYVWSLYFSVLLIRKVRLDIAYALGFLIGGGILTKSTNFFSIYLLPFTLLLFDWTKPKVISRIIRFGLLVIFAVIIAQIFYGLLRLSPLFGMISVKNATFVYPFSEWINDPFLHVISNAKGLGNWLISYLGPSYVSLIIVSIFFIRKFTREKILLFLYFIIPFTALTVFGRTIFPRFTFFMSLPLLCLAGLSLSVIMSNLNERLFGKTTQGVFRLITTISMLFIFIAYSGFVSLQFAYDPIRASIPTADSQQYVNSWTAGWGVKESIAFLQKEARNKKIFVATEGTFGLMPASLELYLVQNKNIIIKGYWPINDQQLPKEVYEYAQKMPSYFIFYQPQHANIPLDYPLKLLFKIQEGNSNYFLRFYQVIKDD